MRYSVDFPSLKISTDGLRGLNKSFNVLFMWTALFLELSYVQGSQTEKRSSSSFHLLLDDMGLGLQSWYKGEVCLTLSKG